MAKGIAIIAGGATKLQAPYHDPAWARWTMNDFYYILPAALGLTGSQSPTWSAVFEMHPPSHYNTSIIYIKTHEKLLGELSEKGLRVYLAFPNPKIPKGTIYPLEQIMDYFKMPYPYFRSTLAFMIPMAIMQIESEENKREDQFLPKIGLWGCDMQLGSEYEQERPCVEWWCGRALERGIEVTAPGESPLLKSPFLYGYETEEVEQGKALLSGRREEVAALVEEAERQQQKWATLAAERRGILSEIGWAEANFTDKKINNQPFRE